MRKVLSFVLVLTLVLSSFSMAFAATPAAAGLTDIAGNANADAIQVAYDLGIVTGNPDGTFLPAKAVNRAEFAAMLTRALDIPDSALAGYTATTFKDTAGYAWAVPYLAFCQSKGILLGDGAGNVMPGKTITVNEAMTMSLRAIGYTANSSLLVGAWPANYVSIAQNNDMYDSVAKETTVDKANAAQIIYNLLTVQKVAVNSDGTTDLLWVDGDQANGAQNLLNSNLGCDSEEDVVLGDEYNYDNSIINITGDLGAFGTAYTNDDGDLVAFTKDSTALTGSVNDDGDFEVGDVTYTFGDNNVTDGGVTFLNTVVSDEGIEITSGSIENFALNADDDDTVTLNVDLSGKKIKDIYSVVAWGLTIGDKASSDVQEDIADQSLLGEDFATTDDDAIDTNSFVLEGVASLDKIAKDNVVYVYSDDDYIRKVTVGTETVTGTVEETDEDSTVTIAGKDYDLAANAVVSIPDDIDVDSEGTFYLDAAGEIYDFDGSAGSTDTFGVVKAATPETDFDNFKVRLYKSDDSTKTLYLSESDPVDLDWTSAGAANIDQITQAALIGYTLDSNGDIDSINNSGLKTQLLDNVTFQSVKVLKIAGVSRDIDSNCAVFTYKTTMTAIDDYDVAALADIEKGGIASAASPASIILNDDNTVVAMFIEETYVDVDDTDVYGVLNSRVASKSGDDDVYKFGGFIDGTEFTKKTDDRTGFPTAGAFMVYKITVDANDVITDVVNMESTIYDVDDASGYIVTNAAITDGGLNSDKTIVTVTNGDKYTIADDAIVYKYDANDEEFTVSKLSALRDGYTVSLYDTKGEDADGTASVVIYQED